MREYWQSLTDREQLLLSVGGIVLAFTLVYFLVARPLVAYRAESERAYQAALSTFETVQLRAAQLAATEAQASDPDKANSDVSLRVAVSVAARQAGVTISRLQPSEDGTLTIWADGVQSQQFYRWLQILADNRGVGPSNVLLQKSSDGETLRAQVRFLEAAL